MNVGNIYNKRYRMRMWMIKPKLLCKKHLMGEHFELHLHRHNFEKKHSIKNRILKGQIEPSSMKTRHDELAIEMLRRGYNHNSKYTMPDISYLTDYERNFKVDINESYLDLINRCNDCKERGNGYKRICRS
jgi:hypothetical protein